MDRCASSRSSACACAGRGRPRTRSADVYLAPTPTRWSAPRPDGPPRRGSTPGRPGFHLDEVLTKGQPVAVTYNDIAGSLQATEIKAIPTAAAAKAAEKRSDGVVKAIGSDWIIINGHSGGGASFEQTLKIDPK